MNIKTIREAIADVACQRTGLTVLPHFTDNPPAPCLMVAPDKPFIDNYQAMNKGGALLKFRLVLVVPFVDDETAQDVMDEYLSSGSDSPESIVDLYENDRTLGGKVASCVVHTVDDYQLVRFGDGENAIRYLAAELLIDVHTTRT